LPPNPIVLQFSPSDHLNSLGKHCLDFHLFNRVAGPFRLKHPTDPKGLLFGHGIDGGPLGEQQFQASWRLYF
jgi:hypothetical protein